MLAKLTDKDGDTVWVNPLHVRSVKVGTGFLGGHKGTLIWLSSELIHGHHVYVRESPDAVASALNAAAIPMSLTELMASEDDHRQSKNSSDDTPQPQ